MWRLPPLPRHQPPPAFLPDSQETGKRHNPEQVKKRRFYKPTLKERRTKAKQSHCRELLERMQEEQDKLRRRARRRGRRERPVQHWSRGA